MDAQMWYIIGIIGFSLAAILLLAATFIFFRLHILAVIGDLSGRTAAKQIEKFRQANAASGAKSFRPDPLNLDRGKLTSPIVPGAEGSEATTQLGETAYDMQDASRTTALGMGTDVLQPREKGPATTMLSPDNSDGATTLLGEASPDDPDGAGATTILSAVAQELAADGDGQPAPHFKMSRSMIVLHTDEVIEE